MGFQAYNNGTGHPNRLSGLMPRLSRANSFGGSVAGSED